MESNNTNPKNNHDIIIIFLHFMTYTAGVERVEPLMQYVVDWKTVE